MSDKKKFCERCGKWKTNVRETFIKESICEECLGNEYVYADIQRKDLWEMKKSYKSRKNV